MFIIMNYIMCICSAVELWLESPLQTVMLLSLVGANCVVGNQWHTTVHTNLDRMTATIQGTPVSTSLGPVPQTCPTVVTYCVFNIGLLL